MSGFSCPLCGGGDWRDVYAATVPLFIFKDLRQPTADRFAKLSMARCVACGHLCNRSFDTSLANDMYGAVPLTNLPAHPSMLDRLRSLTDWLDIGRYAGGDVVEIGCGAGHLARILALKAGRVTVFEPNNALDRSMLPEENIVLVNGLFPIDGSAPVADLLICRQVIEHVLDPAALLRAIRRALKPGGRAYLEIPGGSYIERHAPVTDIHLQHVQYFDENGFSDLAARIGLRELRRLSIKNGHDVGFLFDAGEPVESMTPCPRGPVVDTLSARLNGRVERARSVVRNLPGEVALYGATAHGQAFLNALDGARRFAVVFDDNAAMEGLALYDQHHAVPVAASSPEALGSFEAIIIVAYLHDEVIASSLRRKGFAGTILTVRPTPPPINSDGLVGLFD